jgi:hypothetical protein
MTLADQRQTAVQLTELWRALMPDLACPDESQLLIWAGRDSLDVIATGLNRAAAKRLAVRGTDKPMSADAVTRYASGVMRNVRNDLIAQKNAGRAA